MSDDVLSEDVDLTDFDAPGAVPEVEVENDVTRCARCWRAPCVCKDEED